MKKYLSMLAFAAGAFMLASCSGSEADEDSNNDPKVTTFKITSLPTSSGSRAAIYNNTINTGGASSNVVWESNDQISVFGDADYSNHPYRYTKPGTDLNQAYFSGNKFTSESYYFLYPYQDGATFDGSHISGVTIPTIQKATKGSFDPRAAICGGKTQGSFDVSLSHSCAFFLVTTTMSCKSIKIEPVLKAGEDPWYCTGVVQIDLSSAGNPIKIGKVGGAEYVMLTADGTESCTNTFEAGQYLLAVASSTRFPKIKVTVDYGGTQKLVRYTKPEASGSDTSSLSAAWIYDLGTTAIPPTS